MAENLNKTLYKIEIVFLKIIPFLLAGLNFINTVFWTLNITSPFIVSMSSVSIITISFIYISSYVFKFCEYHRIPLHYVVVNNIINSLDYHFQIPVSDYNWLIINSLIFGAFAIGCGIMKLLNK